MRRFFNWHLVFGPGLFFALTGLMTWGPLAVAQTPNPVTPGYQICTSASGTTKCSFQPVGNGSASLSTYNGLPMAALAVATCGGQTLTAGVPYILTMDLTGTLCSGSGGGGGAVTIADGANVTQGAIADTTAVAGGAGTLSAKARLMTTQLATINTTLGSPFQAGGSIGNTAFGATQSGTWTVQPGNTANTTAWLVTGTGGTFPAAQSGTWTVQPGNTANTTPWLITHIPSAAASAGVAAVSTSALAANLIVKASAGNLYSFEVSADSTLSAAAWWVMIYDATSAPVDGAVTPKKCYAMASGVTSASYGWNTPVPFTSGITIGVSTTGCFTKTASTHAFISGDAQ